MNPLTNQFSPSKLNSHLISESQIQDANTHLIDVISKLLQECGPLNVKHIGTHARGERCARGHRQYSHVANRNSLNILNEHFGGLKVRLARFVLSFFYLYFLNLFIYIFYFLHFFYCLSGYDFIYFTFYLQMRFSSRHSVMFSYLFFFSTFHVVVFLSILSRIFFCQDRLYSWSCKTIPPSHRILQ